MVRILIDPNKVTMTVQTAWKSGLPHLSEEILADCNEYCKEYTGALIQSSLIHSRPKEGKLIWRTPYARRQYWGIRTAHKDKNPNATWKWCEAAKARWRERWAKLAERALRDNL